MKKEKLNNETINGKLKKILLVSGGVITGLGLVGVVLYKKQRNENADDELGMLTDMVLEAGVFDAGISNISRRLDIKRCEYNRYMRGCNVNANKVKGFEADINKFEKLLEYAVKKKATMIQVEE